MTKIGNFDTYKGYSGTICYDRYDAMYRGKIDGTSVEYFGYTLDGLYDQFMTMVDYQIYKEGEDND